MSNIISVVSGKGGVGKTTFSINLAATLNAFGRECIIVDADICNPNVGLRLGIPHVSLSLQNVLNGEVKPQHSIFIHPTNLRIIPSSVAIDNDNINLMRLREVLEQLDELILIDSPPGMDESVEHIIEASDSVMVVTNPEHAAVIDAVKVIKVAKDLGKNNIYVVVNRVNQDVYELTTDEIELMCETPIIAKISEDVNIRKSSFENIPIINRNPYSKASIDYNYLASRLLREEYEPPSLLFLRRLFDK
ncbi:MAG: hypothetical protein B6U97_04725 [Candidatus Altiarchaeales archaeon ex4484_96]|nr:MAG: hypothetical protein B6U97_04725 [Candidatus Altiarchaeales archaeon ex4484_96]